MNIILIIIGSSIAIVGIIRIALNNPPTPTHGDIRIVEDADGSIWTEKYHAFPGWSRETLFDSIEAARERKARWDAIRSKEMRIVE